MRVAFNKKRASPTSESRSVFSLLSRSYDILFSIFPSGVFVYPPWAIPGYSFPLKCAVPTSSVLRCGNTRPRPRGVAIQPLTAADSGLLFYQRPTLLFLHAIPIPTGLPVQREAVSLIPHRTPKHPFPPKRKFGFLAPPLA